MIQTDPMTEALKTARKAGTDLKKTDEVEEEDSEEETDVEVVHPEDTGNFPVFFYKYTLCFRFLYIYNAVIFL